MTRREQIEALEKDWAENPRWTDVERGYSAEDVVRLRGSVQPEYTYAKHGAEKLWKLVRGDAKKGYVNCMGAITGGQAECRNDQEHGHCRLGNKTHRAPPVRYNSSA